MIDKGEIDQTVRSTENPAREEWLAQGRRIPSHGKGMLAPLFPPGNVMNPGGRPRNLKDVRKLARKQSMDALHALIACYKTPDGKIARNVDGRVVVHAASTVLKWAFGEPPPYDPLSERPEERIDLTGLSLQERKRLLDTMSKVSTVIAPDTDVDDGMDFDPSRFEPEPVQIEGEVVPPPQTTAIMAKPKKYKPKTPPVVELEPAERAKGRLAKPKPKAKKATKAKKPTGRPPGRPKVVKKVGLFDD